jgi:hypothetical protein
MVYSLVVHPDARNVMSKCPGTGKPPVIVVQAAIGKLGDPVYHRGRGRCPECKHIVTIRDDGTVADHRKNA